MEAKNRTKILDFLRVRRNCALRTEINQLSISSFLSLSLSPERVSPLHQAPDHRSPPLQLLLWGGRPSGGGVGARRPRPAGEEGRPRGAPLAGSTWGPGVLAVA